MARLTDESRKRYSREDAARRWRRGDYGAQGPQVTGPLDMPDEDERREIAQEAWRAQEGQVRQGVREMRNADRAAMSQVGAGRGRPDYSASAANYHSRYVQSEMSPLALIVRVAVVAVLAVALVATFAVRGDTFERMNDANARLAQAEEELAEIEEANEELEAEIEAHEAAVQQYG